MPFLNLIYSDAENTALRQVLSTYLLIGELATVVQVCTAFRSWLVDSGAYDGLLTLTESGPRTFGRYSMWVYCAHCSVNNEIQAVETTGRLTSVEFPSERPGEPCVRHVYRDPDDIPEEIYVRIGKTKPVFSEV